MWKPSFEQSDTFFLLAGDIMKKEPTTNELK